jgi:thymidylate kinase
MQVTISGNQCTVVKEKGDPKCSGVVNAAGESRLLYHVKNILNAQGYDLIKKRMAKDGHLMDDMQQYLRTRKKTGDPKKDIFIYNSNWSVERADEPFNREGKVILTVVTDVFKN